MLLTMILFFGSLEKTIIQNDAFIYPISRSDIALTENSLLIIEYATLKVHCYSLEGKLAFSFGGKGQAPGEFSNPTSVFYESKTIYVVETSGNGGVITSFDMNGHFVNNLKTATSLFFPRFFKVPSGWLMEDSRCSGTPHEPGELLLFDNFLKFPKKLKELPRVQRGWRPNIDKEIMYNPTESTNFVFFFDQNRQFVIINENQSSFEIYSSISKKRTSLVNIDIKPIPFDISWGEEKLKERKKYTKNFHVKADYPDFFPAIKGIAPCLNGEFKTTFWRKVNESNNESFVLKEHKLKKINLTPSQKIIEDHLLLISDEKVFLWNYNNEKEVYEIWILPLEGIKSGKQLLDLNSEE